MSEAVWLAARRRRKRTDANYRAPLKRCKQQQRGRTWTWSVSSSSGAFCRGGKFGLQVEHRQNFEVEMRFSNPAALGGCDLSRSSGFKPNIGSRHARPASAPPHSPNAESPRSLSPWSVGGGGGSTRIWAAGGPSSSSGRVSLHRFCKLEDACNIWLTNLRDSEDS